MSTMSRERLAEVFVEMADTLVEDFDLLEFLHMVTVRTSELADVAAVGLLLADHHGQLQAMAASDERTKLLELFQVQNREGPCLDAYRTGEPVVDADLRQAGTSWPVFAPRAVRVGFRSVYAIPMRLRGAVIGALNLFWVDTGALAPDDVRLVRALADVATIGLLQERAVRRGEILTEQLQGALNSRIVIEQAKGVLARAQNISVDQAYLQIRKYARDRNYKLTEVATAVVSDPTRVTEMIAD